MKRSSSDAATNMVKKAWVSLNLLVHINRRIPRESAETQVNVQIIPLWLLGGKLVNSWQCVQIINCKCETPPHLLIPVLNGVENFI